MKAYYTPAAWDMEFERGLEFGFLRITASLSIASICLFAMTEKEGCADRCR
jgi:hypothetical protein